MILNQRSKLRKMNFNAGKYEIFKFDIRRINEIDNW